MNNWQISSRQKELLDFLFDVIDVRGVQKVLDVGSGRTSIAYLTEKFKDINIKGIVYPGDQRKIQPIKECVENKNYELIETDLKNFDLNERYDIVLVHLFLGEAEKFGKNIFKDILNKLFSIQTSYFLIVNLTEDNINYKFLNEKISQVGDIIKTANIKSEEGKECLGLTIRTYNSGSNIPPSHKASEGQASTHYFLQKRLKFYKIKAVILSLPR